MSALAKLHCLPLPTPFPVGPVNVYLAEGKQLTLIDTGPKDDATRTALKAGLAALGHRVEDIRRVLITHHHIDHIGLTAEIVRRSGADVITHPRNVGWLTDNEAERARHFPFFQKIWDESGVPEEIVAAMITSGQRQHQWTEPVKVTHTIDEGDVLDLAGATWQVYHTPGHAGGLICLWEAETRTLLANDHLIRDISSNAMLEPPPLMNGPRPKRLVEYLHHMRRMADLHPAIALPGHGEPVEDVPGLVRQRLTFHERRKHKILNALAGRPLTLWELTHPIFPRLTRGVDLFLGLSEILGHLDLLEEDGKVLPIKDGNLLRWARV